MKRIITILSFISILTLMVSCSDKLRLQENDLEKYEWLSPFISDSSISDFKGYHNVDLGTLEFSYILIYRNKSNILHYYDSIAENQLWNVENIAPNKRKYSRLLYQNEITLIYLEFDTINGRLYFNIE